MMNQGEKQRWIQTHGSDYLRRATALGYPCARRYLQERAERELPSGFFIAEDPGPAQRLTVDEPSERALDLVETLRAQGYPAVVVRTSAGEAVMIRDYLGDHRYVAMAFVQ